MSKIEEARKYLGDTIGNGVEYKAYCYKLAGDFACDLLKHINKLEAENMMLKYQKDSRTRLYKNCLKTLRDKRATVGKYEIYWEDEDYIRIRHKDIKHCTRRVCGGDMESIISGLCGVEEVE